MRKIKQMMAGAAVAAFLCGTMVLVNGATCQAAGETYDTALEAAYGDTFRSVYENRLAGSPLEAECADGVDTATGHLMLSRNDLSLDGTGDMDFELNRYYDSNEANLGHATVEYIEELEVDTLWVYYTASDGSQRRIVVNAAVLKNHKNALKNLLVTYEKGEGWKGGSYNGKKHYEYDTQRTKIVSNEGHNVYGLASGWRYDFPWIETVTLSEDEGWGKNPTYLHYGSAGVINIETEADDATKTYSIKGLEGYDYDDIKLENWDKTVDGIACKYLLRDKTGLRIFFNEDGVIVLQKDAHDNTIIFTYTDGIYFSKITDSVGREIVFHYSGEGDEKAVTSVTVQGKNVAGGVSSKTITYETEEKSYTPHYGDRLQGVILTSATVDGSKEKYSYKTVERLVNTSGAGVASQRVSTNQSYLLTKVTADGSEQHYEYRACSLRGEKKSGTDQKRDVVTEQFYVTREYEKDTKTGKKSNGVKYDYFQKKGEDDFRSYADFREKEKVENGGDGINYEVWQYGNSGLKTVTVVSSFNPNKYKTNGKYYDYKYKKSKINANSLKLKNNTKKNVSLYIYNENKLLTDEVNYGQEKEETLYSYDNGGEGSLVVLETDKSYGKKGEKAVTTKEGYTYDSYRNVLIEKSSKAYLAKNKGKEHLYTTSYTYQTAQGYPSGDDIFVCPLVTEESYASATTKNKLVSSMAANGVDYASISEQKSVNGGEYKTIFKTDFQYDEQGNETQGKVYPSYSTDGEKEVIQNDYTYNSLGQQTKKSVTITSAKRPQDNRTYTAEKVTYDSFGNELSYTDENGLTSQTSYDPETGDETETINAVGTEYESKDTEYVSTDGLKTMTVDNYGRVSIEIQDAFGNTVISKDEAAGTWTESTYDYGDDEDNSSDSDDSDDTEEEKEETARLIAEKTYSFETDEKKFIINENGETVANFYMTGKGDDILSATKYFYDDLGNEVGSASFSNGELDAAHCTSFTFSKSETEVTGEDDDAQTISTSYSKEVNPSAYQSSVGSEGYYDQFDDVLTEIITETVTDAEGNNLSRKTTTIRGKNKSESTTTYETDDFGRTIKEETITKNYQSGKWLPGYETQAIYTFDENGNVSQTETKSRKEGDTEWEIQTVKTDYDEQGQITREYTPRGTEEDVATKYKYDILGQMIQSEIPQEKEDGSIRYQTTTTEYDNTGNVTEKEEQIEDDRTAKIEYTYDKQGNLVMVKSCLDEEQAQYVQYVYDVQGNKVRQFTGMTEPLTLTVTEVTEVVDDADVFSYAGKTYQLEISGKKKSDDIRETKYAYDGKNQLISYTDPEGRTETYTYDINSNLTKTVDKNGNAQTSTYDYQNRLTEMVAKEKKTGKETVHTYTYNAYGDVATQDNTSFVYDDVSGQVTEETTRLTKNKNIVKNYTYDSIGNKSALSVKVGDDTKLSLNYTYDGESKLTTVTDEEGNEVAGYSYDTDGNLSERTVVGSGLTTSYTYDYQNHLIELTNQTESAGVISEYRSEYLVNGQKSKETATVQDAKGKSEEKTSTYTYDLLGRITRETKTGSEDISYTYDSNNNRKEMTVGNKVTAYKYNKNDELLRTDTLNTDTEEDSVVIYKNDKNGNQLATVNRYEIPSDQKEETYVDVDVTLGDNRLNENVVNHYNALNQLTQTHTKNYKVSFTYDAEGLRTSKTVNGEKNVFVWDGDQLVMELSEGGKVQKRYIRGNDLVYADKGTGTEKQYYVTDPHGNVVQLTDESGAVTRTYEYDSFGNEVNPDSKDDNPFRYCGEYYDKETEEVYLRARYYQPAVGRFLTRDTYTGEDNEPLSLHLYTYCENDGMNAVDPSGHKSAKHKLYELGRKHVGLKYLKCVYPPEYAYKLTVKIYKKEIKNSARKNYIKKAIIQSIIYRELIFYGFEDAVADTAVALGMKNDSSTGPAQIFAKTAINAHNSFNSKKIEINNKNIKEMWRKLQNDEDNIFYAGLELRRIIEKEYQYNKSEMKKEQYKKVFARYNGKGTSAEKYGKETYKYFIQFKKINKKK